MSRPKVLFFARAYQADFFPTLLSDRYEAVFVTLSRAERLSVEARGCRATAGFEEDYNSIALAPVPEGYLRTSLVSDRFLGHYSTERRREILAKEIGFWRELLEEHKPVAVVNEVVALEISEVLLTECQRAGVRYLAPMHCAVDNMFYWLPDPFSLSGECLTLPEPDAKSIELANAHYDEVTAQDYKPFYAKGLPGRRSLRYIAIGFAKWGLWRFRALMAHLKGGFLYEDYTYEYSKRIEEYVKSLFLGYDTFDSIPPSAEVIFYPLHQEPETTLLYMSEFYANQVATIENILRCMTPEQVLVVKEHPVEKGALFRNKFRTLRKEYSALYFLPAEIPAAEVVRRASRVVVCTSTVGWQAAAIGKTVYVLGQTFFDAMAGLKRLSGWEELRRRMRKPAERSVTRDEVVHFVAQLAAISYPGNPFLHDGLYAELNKQRIIHGICDAAGL